MNRRERFDPQITVIQPTSSGYDNNYIVPSISLLIIICICCFIFFYSKN